jgi:hypothetical protein
MAQDIEQITAVAAQTIFDNVKTALEPVMNDYDMSDNDKLSAVCSLLAASFSFVFSYFILQPMREKKVKSKSVLVILGIIFSKIRAIVESELNRLRP